MLAQGVLCALLLCKFTAGETCERFFYAKKERVDDMGGRGGSSNYEPKGRRMGIHTLIENIKKSQNVLDELSKYKQNISAPTFTVNGNAIKTQFSDIDIDGNKVSLRFVNRYEPTQVTTPKELITTSIEAVTYENGNVTSARTLYEKKSKSLKNAKDNYSEVLKAWKKITNQKQIKF